MENKLKPKTKKQPWVCEKHLGESMGTGFEDCHTCPGFKKPQEGKMWCSRAGAKPVLITAAQAQACDGTNPLVKKNEHQVHYLFHRPAREVADYKVLVSA